MREALGARLAGWFEEHQRPLPWRKTYDPYHVWVSEAMLQQTQVETVIPYFRKFIADFPSVQKLARAREQEILAHWAGLGYYSRARNLAAAARRVAEEHGGAIPCDHAALRALPGIGPYMAGAIMSIAFNQPYAIVDGNVRRVLSRIYGWREPNEKDLWEAAGRLARSAEPRMVNQALMELGATVCSPKRPQCLLCPIVGACVAFKAGQQAEIPAPKRRPETVHVEMAAVVDRKRTQCLMKPAKGFWEFPTFKKLPSGEFECAGECRHTITHHRLRVSVYTGRLNDDDGLEWRNPSTVPISSLTKKILTVAMGPRL